MSGVASSILAEQAAKDAAIVATCDGPRTRIYCLYDEAATEGSDAKEDALAYDPLNGKWTISLPCPKEDLEWIQRELGARSSRITARDMTQKLGADDVAKANLFGELALDADGFLKS